MLFGGFIVVGIVLSYMFNSNEFRKLVHLQLKAIASAFILGTVIGVFSHQFILGVLPSSEWSPIIGWILAGGLGYVIASVTVTVVALLLFDWEFW